MVQKRFKSKNKNFGQPHFYTTFTQLLHKLIYFMLNIHKKYIFIVYMEKIRRRKYHYEIENWNTNTLKLLKSICCREHIFGYFNNKNRVFIRGFIQFQNAKSFSKLQKIVKQNIFLLEAENYEYYKNLENYWESKNEEEEIKKLEIETTTTTLIKQNESMTEQTKEICNYLMKQNQQLLEENKQLKETVITRTITTNNIEKIENNIDNKTFNINLFLNEECKNAITLVDFVNSLKIEDSDLFCAKEQGLVEAITKIFERGLKNYDINSRPLHCTDTKRETLHIKEQNGWVRESGNDSNRIKKAINHISNKKIYKLSQYIREHPEFHDVNSSKYEDCLKMMRGVTGADEDAEKTEKRVLKNIAKSVYIHAQQLA